MVSPIIPKFIKLLKKDEFSEITESVAYGIRCLCSHLLSKHRNYLRHDSEDSHPLREFCLELFETKKSSSEEVASTKRRKLESAQEQQEEQSTDSDASEPKDKLAHMLAAFLSNDADPSQASIVDLLSSQENDTKPLVNISPSASTTPWWDPRKRKAYRVFEGISEECDKFVIQAEQIFVQWPSGELTPTNYPAACLAGNQIIGTEAPSISSEKVKDPLESTEQKTVVPKKKPVTHSDQQNKRSPPRRTTVLSKKKQLKLSENTSTGVSPEYRLMYYKASNKHAIRIKNGKQLFQHGSLEVVKQALAKLLAGSSEDEVIKWSKSQK